MTVSVLAIAAVGGMHMGEITLVVDTTMVHPGHRRG